jgi:penicillin-binding protein 1A
MPSFGELENPEYYLAAQVLSEDGVLLGKISIENRTWTEYKDLSPYLTGCTYSNRRYSLCQAFGY